jgi:hypothetical protein
MTLVHLTLQVTRHLCCLLQTQKTAIYGSKKSKQVFKLYDQGKQINKRAYSFKQESQLTILLELYVKLYRAFPGIESLFSYHCLCTFHIKAPLS